MISDPLGDMLTRIRNGYLAGKKTVNLPFSKAKEAVLKVLVKNTTVSSYQINGETFEKVIQVKLDLTKARLPQIKRVSKPGRRIYFSAKDYYAVKGNKGYLIVSTSKGVMDSYQAKQKKLGGEVIAEIF